MLRRAPRDFWYLGWIWRVGFGLVANLGFHCDGLSRLGGLDFGVLGSGIQGLVVGADRSDLIVGQPEVVLEFGDGGGGNVAGCSGMVRNLVLGWMAKIRRGEWPAQAHGRTQQVREALPQVCRAFPRLWKTLTHVMESVPQWLAACRAERRLRCRPCAAQMKRWFRPRMTCPITGLNSRRRNLRYLTPWPV